MGNAIPLIMEKVSKAMESKEYTALTSGDVWSWGSQFVWFERLDDGSDVDVSGGGVTTFGVPTSVDVLDSAPAVVLRSLRRKAQEAAEEISTAQAATRAAEERLSAQRAEFERWKVHAQEVATDYANRNELCGEFDRCMEEIGLEGRTRDYDVTIRLTVTASDEDAATDAVVGNFYYTSDLLGAYGADVEVERAS